MMRSGDSSSWDLNDLSPLEEENLWHSLVPALREARTGYLLASRRQNEAERINRVREAPTLAERLIRLPDKEARRKINLSRGGVYSFYLVLELVHQGGKAAPSDSEEGLRILKLAERVLERIPERIRIRGPLRWRLDITARLWCERANALRIRRRFPEALQAFRRAGATLRVGSGDAELRARYASLLGSYYWTTDRRRFAALAFRQAAAIYQELGEEESLGEVQLCQAGLLRVEGRLQAAVALQTQALARLDEETQPVTALAAYTNLAEMLRLRDEPESALSVLEASRHLAEELPETRPRGAWLWIRGRCRLRAGLEAESDLVAAWRILESVGDTLSTGLVGADLCCFYLESCNYEQLKHWLGPMVKALEEHAPSPLIRRELAKLQGSVERLMVEAAQVGQALHRIVGAMNNEGRWP